MATTTKKLYRGTVTTNAATVLYTVPTSTTTIITNIVVTNTASSARTFSISIGSIVFGNTVTIAANSIATFDIKQVINAGETIQGGASVADVNFHISGIEVA